MPSQSSLQAPAGVLRHCYGLSEHVLQAGAARRPDCVQTASALQLGSGTCTQGRLCLFYTRSDGSSADEETERVAASAEEELEQLQHLNLGGLDSRDGVLDEVRVPSPLGCLLIFGSITVLEAALCSHSRAIESGVDPGLLSTKPVSRCCSAQQH